MENGEYVLKSYVSKYIDSKLETSTYLGLDRDAKKIFSKQGLSYRCIQKEFANFTIKTKVDKEVIVEVLEVEEEGEAQTQIRIEESKTMYQRFSVVSND